MISKKHFKLSLYSLGMSFLIVGIALIFMPATVPMHYDFKGNIDSYGSKFVFLIFPALSLLFWFIFHLIARFYFKEEKANQHYLYLVAAILNLIFMVLETVFIVFVFVHAEAGEIENSIYKIMNAGIGICFIVIGNILPKITRNQLFGLRTPWSLYNDNTWNKSQRYGGFTLVGTGFLMIIASIFIPGIYNVIAAFLAFILVVTLSLIISYKAYKKEKAKENM